MTQSHHRPDSSPPSGSAIAHMRVEYAQYKSVMPIAKIATAAGGEPDNLATANQQAALAYCPAHGQSGGSRTTYNLVYV
jgi:hypothetical protein